MARLNIETKLARGPRYQNLLIAVGDRHKAKGMLWDLWELAQEYWFPNRELIPALDWRDAGLTDVLIECGFAEKRDEGYYAKGSETEFAWLFARQEAGRKGGEASAARRKPAKKAKEAKQSEAAAKQQLSTSQAPAEVVPSKSNPPSSFLPSPFSSDLALSPAVSMAEAQAPAATSLATASLDSIPETIKSPVGFFIGRYVRAFQRRYGPKARPDLAGKIQGNVIRFVESQPIERAVQLIEAYCQMDGPRNWFRDKGHDFVTFTANLNVVSIALDTGRDASKPAPLKIADILAQQEAEERELADESA